MQITRTTHPPAGATALLPSVDESFTQLGWYFLPVVLLSSTLAMVVALLINNIQRRYPVFWISPPHVKNVPALAPAATEGKLVSNEDESSTQDEDNPRTTDAVQTV